jgi:trigger factor
MNIVVEKQPKCVATLRVEIPGDRVEQERSKVAKAYAGKARVSGFRPGKVPAAVIEKRFGKQIHEEVYETLVKEAYDEALAKESLKVLDFGMPEDLKTNDDGSVTFVSKLTLAPEVKLPEYKGVSVTVPPAELPEEEFEAQLTALRERFAEFKDVEGRPAAMGDFAVIDYTSAVEGKPVEEFLGKPAGHLAGRTGFWVRLDEKAFLPGFAAKLEGMNPGEKREVALTLDEEFPLEELRGKEIVFETTLAELKEAELPELDDELAGRIAPGKTMAEIKDIIRENLTHERRRKIDDMKVNQIVAHFNSQVDFELPDELVTQETQSQADAMVKRGVQAGMSEGEIESQQKEIFASAGDQAVTNLRTNFILQEIARIENIGITDNELVNHLAQIAASRKMAPKKFIRDMQREGRLSNIRNSMTIGKTIDFLVEHANVAESSDTPIDE